MVLTFISVFTHLFSPKIRLDLRILKEISLGCSLEGLMLKLNSSTLATSCEELTHWKRL